LKVSISAKPALERAEDLSMKKTFSVEQIVSVLKQAEVGVPIAELIRKVGISEQTFYRWKAKYVGLEVDHQGPAVEAAARRECPPEEFGGRADTR
jgi:putative transposase